MRGLVARRHYAVRICGIFLNVKFCVAVQLAAAKFHSLSDVGESNPVPASKL